MTQEKMAKRTKIKDGTKGSTPPIIIPGIGYKKKIKGEKINTI
jgi:hypothetical protein